ncbi:MAG: SagB/ThcOx family dehydrogenase, partial [Bacillota bacterium]
ENRRSIRKYKDIPISMEELSYLLWCTQRVKELIPGKATFRTVPSAGARHPFETYLLINNVNGLEPGLYRYIALKHKLIPEKMDEDIADRVTKACLDQRFIKTSAVTFIWAAIPFRAVWRYSERAYRYIHLDAGHVCQNLYLSAEDIDCGVCAIAAYLDDEINNLLGLDGENGFVIYIASLGKV